MNRTLQMIVLVGALLVGSPALAQQTAPTQPVETTEQPTADPVGDVDKRDARRFQLGLGPGLVFWPPDPGDSGGDVSGGITLESRNIYLAPGRIAGWEWTNDIVFHDFKAMGDGYDWYFREPSEDDSISQGVKVGLLWPALVLIPFGGANYSTGAGFIVYTSPGAPAAFFDIGAQANLYLRLSDPDFKADFSIGAYGGGGYEITNFLSVSGRLSWGTPLIHNIKNNTAGSIWTLLATLNFAF